MLHASNGLGPQGICVLWGPRQEVGAAHISDAKVTFTEGAPRSCVEDLEDS